MHLDEFRHIVIGEEPEEGPLREITAHPLFEKLVYLCRARIPPVTRISVHRKCSARHGKANGNLIAYMAFIQFQLHVPGTIKEPVTIGYRSFVDLTEYSPHIFEEASPPPQPHVVPYPEALPQ